MMRALEVKSTLVDRLVSYFDPIRGAQRHRARFVLAMTGGYTGARRDRRQTSEWKTTSGSADADLLPDRAQLVNRSRDLSRNAPLASGAINTVVTNVVGTGLIPQAMIDRELLGLSDEGADTWQRTAEREWWLWALTRDCDAERTLDFCAMQDLVFRSQIESGDVFALRRYIERPGNPYGLKIQVIEADRIENPNFRADRSKLENGNLVAGGVEIDGDGAPVAYHVLDQHPGEIYGAGARKWSRVPAFGPETGEWLMLHLFRKLRPAQRRGAPYLASVIEAFKQLDKYTEAEVMAAVVSAMFTVFVKTESGTGLGTLEPTAETGAKTSDKDIKLASGAIWDLAKGESIEVANPGRPNQAFDPFVNAILAQIGTALEIPFELLIKRFMSSYSAARAALLEAWKAFRTRRAWLAWNFCQPVYEAVITEAVARGRISAPGFFADPLIRQAWLGCEWTGPPPGQIDPEAEINAAKERVDLGVSTLQRETAEISGADWEALHKQRAREKRMRVADGLEADASPGESPTPAAPPRDTPARRERTISRAT